MTAPTYTVLWPLARRTVKSVPLTPRASGAGARRVGFVWDYMFRGNDMFPLIQAGLAERFPGSTFVPYESFGNVHGHDEREVLAALPEKLKSSGVDAVVVGVGA